MVVEFELPVSKPSTKSENFIPPLILNTNFIKHEAKIGYAIWSPFDWEPTVKTITATNGEILKVLYTHP